MQEQRRVVSERQDEWTASKDLTFASESCVLLRSLERRPGEGKLDAAATQSVPERSTFCGPGNTIRGERRRVRQRGFAKIINTLELSVLA
ncbi:hypothetical protein F2P81_017393 [Scophthalmus maximus]|uniref:Uncharacterized protein n=1 Tax=Scophthalmus maximus TaxID=52904 RepID=A0A6A4SJX8_SCOMX|nr:hypothetical protein F2P81_017393 [Scophthalmus maximus]